MEATFKAGERFRTLDVIYVSAADAVERKNKRYLVTKYQNKTITCIESRIHKGGLAYLAYADAGPIGFFAPLDVEMLGAPSEALPTEGMLTEHFKKSEFICDCKGKKCNGYNGISDTELKKTAEFLEGFRSAVGGKAITLNSGVRCPSANKAAGGSDGSQHLYGRAADIKVSGMAQSAVDKAALAYCRGLKYGGVGYQAKGFTHLDRRNEASKPGIVTWLY